MDYPNSSQELRPEGHRFVFEGGNIESLTEVLILQYTTAAEEAGARDCSDIFPEMLQLNRGIFSNPRSAALFPAVAVVQESHSLVVSCGCSGDEGKLCRHEALVLTAILRNEDFGIFFNAALRRQVLKKYAADYGLEKEKDLDHYVEVSCHEGKVMISIRQKAILPVSHQHLNALEALFSSGSTPGAAHTDQDQVICVVLKKHKYYKHLQVALYLAAVTKDGKIKNPLNPVNPLDFIWAADDPDHVKFYTGVHKFQNPSDGKRSESDIAALRAIVRNPAGHDFYYHDNEVSEKITASSVVPIKAKIFPGRISLAVSEKGDFYELAGSLMINETVHALKDLDLKFDYFLRAGSTLYLIDRLYALAVVDLLKKRTENLLVHVSRYPEFRERILAGIEDKIKVDYRYITPATQVQMNRQGFRDKPIRMIYLSDSGKHVMVIPVMRYGDVEIPVRTKRNIYATDDRGKEFIVNRDDEAEAIFTAMVMRQHPFFEEQMDNDLHYFYLHRERFLAEDWFLDTFEEWRQAGVIVLGFDELEGNKLNPYKVKIDIKVLSGINWFNAVVEARFGARKASLKQLQKAVRSKNKYVQLDDGSLGILPVEWLEKFADYFNAGEISDEDLLQIPKVNFAAIEAFCREDEIDSAVKSELALYRERFRDFKAIADVAVPAGLQATLRPYQKEGLNWLNFLDDFNFGGCLADDMGLGKSVQIIAFILSQRTKAKQNTNLLVVPATLIFNWQKEVEKFAPSIKVFTIYGANRIKDTGNFDNYEIVLTSYGTMLSDIDSLKEYAFNYVFLDESQNIKNPETQRYKAACQLQSRNRIAITGTPVENNTFDLYGQLSFACPGLLGNKQYFRDVYAAPVDTFKNNRRALELQQKIKPFLLRRTKEEVAPELPDKTEMVLYCDMGIQQRKIYNAYEKEFRDYISATTGEQLKRSPMNVLKGLTRLRQVCNAPSLLGDNALQGTESAKIDMLMEQIAERSPQHKILVFSQFVSMIRLIEKQLAAKGIGYECLTGATRNRGDVVSAFQHNPDSRVFLISLKAGGTGLNLTEADYVYLVDPWWNPAVENQAIDRAHRIGQKENVVVVRLISPATVEEKIMHMQESKRLLTRDLVPTDTAFLQSLAKEELLDLLRPLA